MVQYRHASADGAVMQPAAGSVVAAPLADQVFDLLRSRILAGQIAPGTRLRVSALAESVGTSVMPVREAVRRLIESGLAVNEPYKGARVRSLSVDELEATYDARILIEGECARRGALAADDALVDRMRQRWEELESSAREGRFLDELEHDEELLSELYSAVDNRVLVGIVRNLWDTCRPYKVLWASTASGGGEIGHWRFKPALIDAVAARDGERAKRVMAESYQLAKDSIRETLLHTPAG